jgi:hypothetical protein
VVELSVVDFSVPDDEEVELEPLVELVELLSAAADFLYESLR